MKTIDVTAGPEGFEHRIFKCSLCGQTQESVIVCDPISRGRLVEERRTEAAELSRPSYDWRQGERGGLISLRRNNLRAH
jgi:hypothetical protein